MDVKTLFTLCAAARFSFLIGRWTVFLSFIWILTFSVHFPLSSTSRESEAASLFCSQRVGPVINVSTSKL